MRGNLRGCDHSCHGESISNPLGHGDNVRDHIMALEAPVVVSSPPKPSLDLIRDAHSSQLPHPLKGPLEVTPGILDRAPHTLDRLSKEASNTFPFGQGISDQLFKLIQIFVLNNSAFLISCSLNTLNKF